jgi:hypothetical protein
MCDNGPNLAGALTSGATVGDFAHDQLTVGDDPTPTGPLSSSLEMVPQPLGNELGCAVAVLGL